MHARDDHFCHIIIVKKCFDGQYLMHSNFSTHRGRKTKGGNPRPTATDVEIPDPDTHSPPRKRAKKTHKSDQTFDDIDLGIQPKEVCKPPPRKKKKNTVEASNFSKDPPLACLRTIKKEREDDSPTCANENASVGQALNVDKHPSIQKPTCAVDDSSTGNNEPCAPSETQEESKTVFDHLDKAGQVPSNRQVRQMVVRVISDSGASTEGLRPRNDTCLNKPPGQLTSHPYSSAAKPFSTSKELSQPLKYSANAATAKTANNNDHNTHDTLIEPSHVEAAEPVFDSVIFMWFLAYLLLMLLVSSFLMFGESVIEALCGIFN